MSTHTWVQQSIESYLAGGLDPGERERLEQHLAECGECASSLDDSRAFDRHLMGIFTGVQPDAALEDRMIQRLRRVPSRRSWRPSKALFAVMGAAAAVLMSILGGWHQRCHRRWRHACAGKCGFQPSGWLCAAGKSERPNIQHGEQPAAWQHGPRSGV